MALDFVRSRQASTLPRLPYLFDAGYGTTTEFRDALTAMGEQYVGGVTFDISVWAEGTTFVALERKPGAGRPPVRLQAADGRKPVSVEAIARALPPTAWKVVHWRDGSRGPQRSRFAATRVRAARGTSTTGAIHPRDVRAEEWLLIHWSEDAKGPTKAWLSNLGPDATLTDLVRLARVRWRIERDHQECKELLGFDHYEGRTWQGLHHHLALVLLSHQILALERLRAINDGDPRREPALFPPVDREAGRDGVCTCRCDHGRDRAPRLLPVPDVLALET
jgi:SRSO17 transposase